MTKDDGINQKFCMSCSMFGGTSLADIDLTHGRMTGACTNPASEHCGHVLSQKHFACDVHRKEGKW